MFLSPPPRPRPRPSSGSLCKPQGAGRPDNEPCAPFPPSTPLPSSPFQPLAPVPLPTPCPDCSKSQSSCRPTRVRAGAVWEVAGRGAGCYAPGPVSGGEAGAPGHPRKARASGHRETSGARAQHWKGQAGASPGGPTPLERCPRAGQAPELTAERTPLTRTPCGVEPVSGRLTAPDPRLSASSLHPPASPKQEGGGARRASPGFPPAVTQPTPTPGPQALKATLGAPLTVGC